MNKNRAQFTIELDGVEYEAGATFDSACVFETKACVYVFDALRSMRNESIGFKVIASAIWAAIRAGYKRNGTLDQCPSFDFIGQKCMDEGVEKSVGYAAEFLSKCVSSKKTLEEYEETTKNEVGEG